MTKRLISGLLALVLVAPALWASKEMKEAKKLDKELKKISLTAAVPDGRRVVNRVMAHELGVTRQELVKEREKTGFVYGQLFGAHEVGKQVGMNFDQVAEQMKQGHSLLDISQEHDVNLKDILDSAKMLNKHIDKELDRIAAGDEDETAEDSADDYDPAADALSADTSSFTPSDLAQANQMVHGRALGLGNAMGNGPGAGMGAGRGVGAAVGGGMGRGRH
ncbi:MAG: hypothetical protein LAP13_11380 [Acidobacteriia bacterium]|nr:hypothetical protein [Terriglobia bacterium]